MPKCSICGKNLQNPNSRRHINSAYHQNALQKKSIVGKHVKPLQKVSKDISVQQEINKLKEIVKIIDERVKSLEDLILDRDLQNQYSITDDDVRVIEKSIIGLIKERSALQRIKGMISIKEINKIIKKKFKISEDDFIDLMMRLYRKQMIDLQPGGNPRDYHLKSPTGREFYYVSLKN